MADPVQTQTYTSNIPQELLPYAQTLLDTASQFTDIEKNPFQQYQGERVAQTSPLLQQAMDTASQMGVSGQIESGSALAGAAGLEALTPYSFTDTGMAQQYMSPYMQNVVDVQQLQAKRQADIAAQQQKAQAANAGAFGGGRDAIMRAQANAELQRNLQGIQATGLQNAFQQGMQQYNQEQGQRMQGLGLANQAASTLGSLGQNQFAQTSGIVGLQGQLGQLEQQHAQEGLNAQYQDYLNYQNYPYKQLGFMSDLIRGTPVTTSASSIYQAPPSTMQNLMSLGLGAYGLNSLFGTGKAAGGEVKGYAYGGSVMSDAYKEYAVDHIDPRQLPVAQRNAAMRGDMETAQDAQEQMAMDAALRRGVAAALPQGVDVVRAAGGGILAFAQPTQANNFSLVTEPTTAAEGAGQEGIDEAEDNNSQRGEVSAGNPRMQNMFSNKLIEVVNRMEARKGYVPLTPQERRQAETLAYKELEAVGGPDPYKPAIEALKQQDVDRATALQEGKGLAALKAAGAVLQGNNAMRGLGAAGAAYADSYSDALKADKAEKRFLSQMQFSYADAQRKEKMGLFREARQDVQNAETARFNADKAATMRDQAVGNMLGKAIQGTRPIGGGGGAGGKERDQAQAMRVFGADLKRQFPEMSPEQIEAQALQMYLEKKGSGLPGVEARTDAAVQKEARTAFNNRTQFGGDSLAKEYRAADKAGDTAKAAELKARIAAEEGYNLPGGSGGGGGGGGTTPKAPDISSVTGAPKGAKIGSYVQGKGYEVKDSKGTLIGYAQGQ